MRSISKVFQTPVFVGPPRFVGYIVAQHRVHKNGNNVVIDFGEQRRAHKIGKWSFGIRPMGSVDGNLQYMIRRCALMFDGMSGWWHTMSLCGGRCILTVCPKWEVHRRRNNTGQWESFPNSKKWGITVTDYDFDQYPPFTKLNEGDLFTTVPYIIDNQKTVYSPPQELVFDVTGLVLKTRGAVNRDILYVEFRNEDEEEVFAEQGFVTARVVFSPKVSLKVVDSNGLVITKMGIQGETGD